MRMVLTLAILLPGVAAIGWLRMDFGAPYSANRALVDAACLALWAVFSAIVGRRLAGWTGNRDRNE